MDTTPDRKTWIRKYLIELARECQSTGFAKFRTDEEQHRPARCSLGRRRPGP